MSLYQYQYQKIIGTMCVLTLFILFLNEQNECKALRKENAKLREERPPTVTNGVMFHLLASENYRLGGEAKNFLPQDMVIPHDEVNDLLKNGWFHPNGVKDGAIPNVPDKAGR